MTELATTSTHIDARLLEDIRSGNCVAFVGAGFSAAAGLPSWRSLLAKMASTIPDDVYPDTRQTLESLVDENRNVSNRELEMAAQLLFDVLGVEKCRILLQQSLKRDPLPRAMQLRLKHLYGIPFRAIVTTNFDPLIKGVSPDPAAYRRLLRTPPYSPWREAIARAALGSVFEGPTADAPDRPVIQLHGTLDDDGTIVFTRSQYRRRLYANPAYLTVLRSLLATSSVLFLGYSLKDAYLNELRAELVEALKDQEGLQTHKSADRPLAWAVLEDVSDVARTYYEKHEGLGVIPYRTTQAGRDHSGFDALLEKIYAETNPIHRLGQILKGRRLMWFDPSPSNNELGRRLITEAVRDVEGSDDGSRNQVLVEVFDRSEAIQRIAETPPFDLIISHWGHGFGPDGRSNGEALLEAASALRARGARPGPVIIFAGPAFAKENRRHALSLGAVAFTSDWHELMHAIERALGGNPSFA